MTDQSQIASSSSQPAGSDLLDMILGLPKPDWNERVDYTALGVGPAHESELIGIATDPTLLQAEMHSAESWAPVHAVRSLGELRSDRAVAPLLEALASGAMDDDWMAHEVPEALAAIGSPAVSPLLAFAGDRSRGFYARMVAVEGLGAIGGRRDADRQACIDGLTRILEGSGDEDPSFNAMVIGELVELDARDAAPVIRSAFEADRVDLMHMGDWEDVQIELGLLTDRITPRPPLGLWVRSSAIDAKPLPGWRDLGADAADALERVLGRPGRSWGPKSKRELEGFLFAVACAPDVVRPSDWIAALIEDGEPFEDEAHARAALDALITLYGIIQEGVNEPSFEEPESLFRDDLMANLQEDAEVGEWCRGFVIGHSWLEDLWDVSGELEALVEEELGPLMFALSFFASRSLAERYQQELSGGGKSLEQMAETVRECWGGALVDYATLGRSLLKAQMNATSGRLRPARAEPRPGRNDPCLCGSGRKYKRCCGQADG
jgi:yecA family protein